MSLCERAADFRRSYPNKKISSTTLKNIYQKNIIRKKKVRITKIPDRKLKKKITRNILEAKSDLDYYRAQGFRIIYLDETMVTKSTIATHEWSNKNKNFEMDMKDFGKETVAVLAGISKEKGLDYVATFDKSVNIPKFKEYL